MTSPDPEYSPVCVPLRGETQRIVSQACVFFLAYASSRKPPSIVPAAPRSISRLRGDGAAFAHWLSWLACMYL